LKGRSTMFKRTWKIKYAGWSFAWFIFFLFNLTEARTQSFSLKNYSTRDGLSSSKVYSCNQDSKGYLWFCTDAGVSRFDGKKFELFTRRDGLSDNEVFRCLKIPNNESGFLLTMDTRHIF
jgi:ligand-binding sensor domain-containing protein